LPTALTYPGVYIEEVKSGVRTVTGVATSIAAFVGITSRGPADEPITINNFSDFQRTFGGLTLNQPLGFAVRDFFLNGGSQAIVVRVIGSPTSTSTTTPAARAQIEIEAKTPLLLEASSTGSWGNHLEAVIDYGTSEKPAAGKSDADRTLFNLTVADTNGGKTVQTEKFLNVAFDDTSPRYLPRVLKQQSTLVQVKLKNAAVADVWEDFTLPDKSAVNAEGNLTPQKATTDTGQDGEATLQATDLPGNQERKTGIYALEKTDIFNLLCIPSDAADGVGLAVLDAAAKFCEERRAMLLVDPPRRWTKVADAINPATGIDGLGARSANAALFFPRLIEPNPLLDNQLQDFAPCGAVAGIFARTDAQRGVWKAPAGVDATLAGVADLSVHLTDAENGQANPLAINCLRTFPVVGRVIWGSRTTKGADVLSDDYKYLPVRRLALFMEESLFRGMKWVVFEPNDEPLWAQIRLNVGAFMHNLFRQGAFQGTTPRDAYFVKCDKETTIQNDINLGIVNVVVGFAPLKPAEFVVIKLQQIAGQIDV
jgi:phage tail sheath protein FI